MSKSKANDGRGVLQNGQPEVAVEHPLVDLQWLIKAGLLSILAAAVLAYAVLCLLFYQGQWQIVLHPAPMQAIPQKALPPYEVVHFAFTESGQPTLYGWWVPADKAARFEQDAVILFPSGADSISSLTTQITLLHQQRINVLAFDYRGFGNSAKVHPDQTTLEQDSLSAVQYVTGTRHISASRIVLFGEALGSLPALYAATQTNGIAGVILADPRVSQQSVFDDDARTHLLPMHLLLRSDYSIEPGLAELKPPALVLCTSGTQQGEQQSRAVLDLMHGAKSMVSVPNEADTLLLLKPISNFLDSVLIGSQPGASTPVSRPADSGIGPVPAASPEK